MNVSTTQLSSLSTTDLQEVTGGLSYYVFPIDRYPIDYPVDPNILLTR